MLIRTPTLTTYMPLTVKDGVLLSVSVTLSIQSISVLGRFNRLILRRVQGARGRLAAALAAYRVQIVGRSCLCRHSRLDCDLSRMHIHVPRLFDFT